MQFVCAALFDDADDTAAGMAVLGWGKVEITLTSATEFCIGLIVVVPPWGPTADPIFEDSDCAAALPGQVIRTEIAAIRIAAGDMPGTRLSVELM